MKLSVIVISFNTRELLRKCLAEVYQSLNSSDLSNESEVIVVDNASKDDSVAIVAKNYPEVKIIKNKENLGFAKANNQAMKKSSGEYILLLNSDTEVEKDALTKLISVIKRDPEIGVVGGKLINADGSVQASAGFFPNLIKIFCWMFFLDDIFFLSPLVKPFHVENKSFYRKQQFIDWVTGACFLIKREVADIVGLLDENLFMYGEEMEWCYRIKGKGYKVVYDPSAEIFHRKGGSAREAVSGIVEEFKALVYFYKKYKPTWQLPLLRLILKLGALLRIVIFGIIGKYPARLSLYAKAIRLV